VWRLSLPSRSSRSSAGPNGAGKTTFSSGSPCGGLSPLKPELAARQGGHELNRLASARDFAFDYLKLLEQWKTDGYRIEIVFLSLPSVALALQRIAVRVRQMYHELMSCVGMKNFQDLADKWSIYDNSGPVPRLQEERP
jgi:predicted ABC-type ATPase